MIRKILAVSLSVLLLCGTASAATVEFTVDKNAFFMEEEGAAVEKALEAAPFISAAGRTMVPVRAIAEAFGAAVGWEAEAARVTIKKADTEITLTIGQSEAYINGAPTVLDAAPEIVEGRTMVPLRFIGEALSCQVQYVAATKQILIEDAPVLLSCGTQTASLWDLKAAYAYLYKYYETWRGDMEEEEYADTVAYLATEAVSEQLYIRAAFPAAYLSEADVLTVQFAATETAKIVTVPLSGYLARWMENLYYQDGGPIVDFMLRERDIAKIYTDNFVCAKHILVEDEALAGEIYEKAAGGADFDALLAEHNIDPGMEQNPDGYVFTKGEMVKPFEEAAFSAAEGEITAPVQTDYGYHIIKRMPLPAMDESAAAKIALSEAETVLMTAEAPTFHYDTETLCKMIIAE